MASIRHARNPMLGYSSAFLMMAMVHSTAPATEAWICYQAGPLVADRYSDGDSFNGVVGLKEGGTRRNTLNWRLYGVDCPETDMRNADRVREQAGHFRVREESLLDWGKRAAEFSAEFLSKPFTVHTLREDAGGTSSRPRHYAIVMGGDGRFLHEALLEAGLARAYGMPAPWPEGTPEARFEQRLRMLEIRARNARVGIWGARD